MSKSSTESPPARYSRMVSTGYRRPRTHGLPWQISGSTVIGESRSWFEISSTYLFTLLKPSSCFLRRGADLYAPSRPESAQTIRPPLSPGGSSLNHNLLIAPPAASSTHRRLRAVSPGAYRDANRQKQHSQVSAAAPLIVSPATITSTLDLGHPVAAAHGAGFELHSRPLAGILDQQCDHTKAGRARIGPAPGVLL